MINIDYEYVDESSIDENYKCSICSKPFKHPVTTPCDHSYCQDCIQYWLDQGRSSCPTCRQTLSSNDLTPITTRLVLNILDRLLVKCSQCQQNGIQRGNLNDHITKFCPKTVVICTASDIKCPWSSTRDELQNHLLICNYERLRSVLTQLININQQFEEQIQTLTNHVQTLQSAVHNPTSRLITFDKLIDIENKIDSGLMPELYEGLRWVNVWYMHEQWVKTNHPISGWKNAYTNNHTCIVFNGKGNSMKICSKHKGIETFTLISFEATSAWHDNLQINVIGKRVKQDIYSTTIILQFNNSKVFQFDWKDIDQIKFIPINGTQHSDIQYDEKYFALTWILLR
ncbi:unnamed protein product [Rotaria sp. Silwood2]|nr:unnamed protein product [Rotaria sp. Silwood2]CAF2615598.1 unnamed protein product [Rotaria sp. Silwood2]CAF2869038.1 unnamed protein product [Rotaria sp. Silwood2]CAF3942738.1 unnamed protein product [Rotaria sp. Silwood2]CAF3981224.1 unnamed protein product [Rotaria sp. Silwood2]